MNIEKMREEFEGWVQERSVDTPAGFYPQLTCRSAVDQTCYMISWVDSAWEGWQASRAAIEVELPEHFEYDNPGEAFPAIKDCRKAIEALGLKVKS